MAGENLLCIPFTADEDERTVPLPEGGWQPGSAAVATFNEIKTNKIEIEFDKDDMLGGGDELRIAEIVVLGK